jgi:cell division protein FtsL
MIGSLLLGLVSLNALLAQRSFRIDDLRQRVGALTEETAELAREQAALSAPGRIAAWARRHGMRLPDDIRFLHVPSTGSAAPAGAADLDLEKLKAALESGT